MSNLLLACSLKKEKKERKKVKTRTDFKVHKKIIIRISSVMIRHSNKHARSLTPQAPFAFKDSMIHGILQFTLRIAFRCVLHRCESQEIRCQKLLIIYKIISDKIKKRFKYCWSRKTKRLYNCTWCIEFWSSLAKAQQNNHLVMIQPQVHLRLPCYDF